MSFAYKNYPFQYSPFLDVILNNPIPVCLCIICAPHCGNTPFAILYIFVYSCHFVYIIYISCESSCLYTTRMGSPDLENGKQ